MPPKKKLSKKEKARLEAEQAELLRIEMEKEKLKKLEEERQRKRIELEQAKRRQQQEIQENKQRRAQLRNSMDFFAAVREDINGIRRRAKAECDWDKFMRCNGLPNASSPSDLRKYVHQWCTDIELRQRRSRNWLLRTDELTLLTQDSTVEDLTRTMLRQKQGNLGDVYARRIREVLGILNELDDALNDKSKPTHTVADLARLKTEIRVFLSEHLDEFTYKTLSHIERDMKIERPGVSLHAYSSDVFKTQIWSYSKDAQLSKIPKQRVVDPNQHNEVDFLHMEMQISLPPSVVLPNSAMRGRWLNYDHLSDYCPSYALKRKRSDILNILIQTKREWRKRKEILQSMLDDCSKDSPHLEQDASVGSQQPRERSFDVDKLYTEYEDELNKARRQAIGPEAYGMAETDVNLRKYRIISGVYSIDYLETPQQDKRLNARSFIRTIISPDCLQHKSFFQTYKPPPPVLPGVRRLPEEIEAEMRMIEAALDKLALVTLQLPDSVIWFEPPIACRWETPSEALEADLIEGAKPHATATPTEATPLSTTANVSPLKCSPRFPAKLRKRSSQKTPSTTLPVRTVDDFDMFNIPHGIDIYSLFKDFVVPRLPQGFCVRMEERPQEQQMRQGQAGEEEDAPIARIFCLARHKSVNHTRAAEETADGHDDAKRHFCEARINEDYLDFGEPGELFPEVKIEKVLKFCDRNPPASAGATASTLSGTSRRVGVSINVANGGDNRSGSIDSACEDGAVADASVSSLQRSNDDRTQTPVLKKTYMFSNLIEDLDRLCELQVPLQEELLNQISVNLTNSAASNGSKAAHAAATDGGSDEHGDTDKDNDNDDDGAKATTVEAVAAAEAETKDALQPSFGYYTSISFMRDFEARLANGGNGKAANDTDNEADEDDDDDDDSSSCFDEFGDEDDYDLDGEELENAVTMTANSEEAALSGGLHDFLSKHNQSHSDSADGSKSKAAIAAAMTLGRWSVRDVHDTKFNEDKLSIQFRTGRFGIFGFALNRYSNMPYQTWEVKPDFKSPGTVLFSFTASIVSLDMTITSAGYCMNNFQGGSTAAISELIGRTVSLAELRATLISSAVDIFPDEDAFCYTEGSCEKNYVMEMHLYACISTLALSHNFSWSRWNLLAGSRTAVLLIRELIEGKKVPYHSTLLVTPLKTAIIDCTEVSASFNATGIEGMAYYADLYQLSQVHAQPASIEKQRTMEPVLRDNVAHILMAIRPLSFC